jgi:CheY-like chemotaxis protein
VDDEPIVAEALRRLLKAFNHQVEVAGDGESALELFGEGSFDLVITDYRMPGIDGLELAKLIRERAPQQPILMMTGHMEGLSRAASQTSVDAVLPKPCKFEEFRDAFVRIFLGA